jgi:hypothetical protein
VGRQEIRDFSSIDANKTETMLEVQEEDQFHGKISVLDKYFN